MTSTGSAQRLTAAAAARRRPVAAKATKRSRRVPAKSLAVFTRQLSVMIDAGLPLVQCLELLAREEPNKGLAEPSPATDIPATAPSAPESAPIAPARRRRSRARLAERPDKN